MTSAQDYRISGDLSVKAHTFQTIIIGSGAAGLNCAEHLWELGIRDIAVITDRLGAGTSNNSGSDKQTYYKIGIFGDVPDSPMEFARSLTAGGMCHGDLAYVEALGSAPEFFHLVRNGVPFPFNRYGAYVGYKTDHDPRQRATSAGPKTSMLMYQGSLANVRRNETPIFDGHEVIGLLVAGEREDRRVIGAVALDREALSAENFGLVVFRAENVVLATGGPGEMYRDSVYPPGQIGTHGLALKVGAIANNLTESQFGLASVGFRWNLSGTYQQVIPSYFSTDANGEDKRYFLNEYFHDMRREATNIFLKGYQWPFHAERLQDFGSSIVDLAVFNETSQGRRVFMDFRHNPVADHGLEPFSLTNLDDEARRYLERSGALQSTPYERLQHMNPESIELYEEHGVDLRQPLEVAVCAQHCNGGMRGDIWWESNIRHLFTIGELNGSHGVRPGGSALNSGQVGGVRAAQRIAHVYNGSPLGPEDFWKLARPQIRALVADLRRHLNSTSELGLRQARLQIQERMSEYGAFMRSADGVAAALDAARAQYARMKRDGLKLTRREDLPLAVQNENLCLTQIAFLAAMKALIARGGGSRGAYVVLDEQGDRVVSTKRGTELPHRSENLAMRAEVLEVKWAGNGDFEVYPVEVRALPDDQSWYETTWREWRQGKIFTD